MNTQVDVYAYTDDTVAANLARIMNDLVEANADAALLERLRAAPARIIELTAEQDALIAQQLTLADTKAKAAEDARFARFTNIAVRDLTPDDHVVGSTFEVTWTSMTWDSNAHESMPKQVTMTGLGALPEDVLAYLIERHPEQVPAKITRLAPNPYDAFDRYFVSLSRGYLKGNSYDVQRAAGV